MSFLKIQDQLTKDVHKQFAQLMFSGKKLLILGTSVASVDIVKYAKDKGAYTIVADYLSKEKSLAKQFADECVNISTADTEALDALIKRKRIDAVFAGVSEFNLLQAMKLSSLNNLRFYCTRQQWDTIECKDLFRKLCIDFGVPCPVTYTLAQNNNGNSDYKFPIIIKPVDACASIGITICDNRSQIEEAIERAKTYSPSGKYIIEDFLEGQEFTATYTIVDGKSALTAIDQKYGIALNEGLVTSSPMARIYPPDFIEEYISQVNDKVIRLCDSLMLNVGTLFVQGLYNKTDNTFCIFEGGLRCAGEASYRITSRINGIHFMHNLVDYALLGRITDYDVSKEDPMLNSKMCGKLSIACKGGTQLGRITGVDEVMALLPQVIDYECRYAIGDMLPTGNTLRQIVLRFALICDNLQQLKDCIRIINERVFIFDESGNDISIKLMSFDNLR